MFNCGTNLATHHEKVGIEDLIDSTQGNFVAHEYYKIIFNSHSLFYFLFLIALVNSKPNYDVRSTLHLLQLLGDIEVEALRSCAPQQTLKIGHLLDINNRSKDV
jgi:hypothetical protein